VTLLTFIDPRCWTDCPLLAAQLKSVRAELPKNTKLDLVAVAADPYHEQLSDLRHFIDQHGLTHVEHFYFVTGKLSSVRKVWASYGIGVSMTKTDKMSIHSDYMFIVNAKHILKWVIPDDPISSASGQASASQSSVISSLTKASTERLSKSLGRAERAPRRHLLFGSFVSTAHVVAQRRDAFASFVENCSNLRLKCTSTFQDSHIFRARKSFRT